MNAGNPKKFFVDSTVLRLGKWLRYLGFDTSFVQSEREMGPDGVFLTKRKMRTNGSKMIRFVPFDRIEEQLTWFKEHFGSEIDLQKVGSRCIRCNEPLVEIPKESVKDRVPDYIYQTHTVFRICPSCKRIYWRGSHPERMLAYLERIGIFARDGT